MTDVNVYYYIESLSLTAAQKNTLVDQLKAIGKRDTDLNPHNRNHWRVRLDNNAVIFEGWFDDANLTAVGVRNRLAAIFGVANTAITYTTTQTSYGPVVLYRYNSQDKLRCGVFGGLSATWAQSHDAVLSYLAANRAQWEPA